MGDRAEEPRLSQYFQDGQPIGISLAQHNVTARLREAPGMRMPLLACCSRPNHSSDPHRSLVGIRAPIVLGLLAGQPPEIAAVEVEQIEDEVNQFAALRDECV